MTTTITSSLVVTELFTIPNVNVMSNWNHSVLYYNHEITDKLDELAKMISEKIHQLESSDDWDINDEKKYRLFRKFDDFYDECIYTSMSDI